MKYSAGLIMYRHLGDELQIYLVHPGGPYWKDRDEWGVPKGEITSDGEYLLDAAIREFEEETGIEPSSPFIYVGDVSRKGKKIVSVWAFEYKKGGEPKPAHESNYFEMEWPKGSGKILSFPEVDDARFFSIQKASEKMHSYQKSLIDKFLLRLHFINLVRKRL